MIDAFLEQDTVLVLKYGLGNLEGFGRNLSPLQSSCSVWRAVRAYIKERRYPGAKAVIVSTPDIASERKLHEEPAGSASDPTASSGSGNRPETSGG